MPNWLDALEILLAIVFLLTVPIVKYWRRFESVYLFLCLVQNNLGWSYLYLRCNEYKNALFAIVWGPASSDIGRSITVEEEYEESLVEAPVERIIVNHLGVTVAMLDPLPSIDDFIGIRQLPSSPIPTEETEVESLRRAFRPGLSMREVARRANRPGINKDNVRSKLEKYGIM